MESCVDMLVAFQKILFEDIDLAISLNSIVMSVLLPSNQGFELTCQHEEEEEHCFITIKDEDLTTDWWPEQRVVIIKIGSSKIHVYNRQMEKRVVHT